MRRRFTAAACAFAGLALFAAPAQASLTGVTQPATSVTWNLAVLNGSVEPSGSLPTYYFEYGLTSAYGAQTAAIPFVSPMKVQAVVSGLLPSTTYHFRVVAARPDRASRGADHTFTTAVSPLSGTGVGGSITDPVGGRPGSGTTVTTGTGSPSDGTPAGDGSSSSGSGSGSGSSGSGSSGSGTGSSGSGTGSSGSGTGSPGSDSGSGSGSSSSGSSGSGGDPDRSGSGDGTKPGGDDGGNSGSGGDGTDSPAGNTAPVLGSTVGAAPEDGSVRVRAPGDDGFVPLDVGTPIAVGSIVDSRRGSVRLVTAVGDAGAVQDATFHGAIFQVRQRRGAGGLTDLVLRGGDFSVCRNLRTRGRVSAAGDATGPSVVAARRRRPVRRLWGRDHNGSFRTHGRGAVATVRGTTWAVADYCHGTRTSVRSGAVLVRDKRLDRTVLVRAGHSYFARTSR